jgi:hypothetical protein
VKTPFLWIPGQGCDRAALARMRRSFPRPREPMGEAWFMGETRALFWELLGELDTLSMEHLGPALYEIGSGTKNLGERNEWTDWFHYILAQTLPRAHETYAFHSLVESLATTFFLLYPEDISREPYKGFRRDALDTLGRSMMNAECWDGDRVRIGAFLHRYYNEQAGAWFWRDASGDFAASMFFCLKYLGSEEVAPWLRSVLAITDPHWRSQIIVWFVGAHDLLAGRFLDPSGYEVSDCPSLSWEASHLLKRDTRDGVNPHFLPRPNREAALATLEAFMGDDLYLEWLCSISEFDYLESELADLPERFRELYILDAPAPL